MRHVEWMNLPAPALQEAARAGCAVILPVASVEQHGSHLPSGVDAILVTEVARRAAGVAGDTLVAPTIWHGLAEHHMPLGGTFTLDLDTFRAVLSGLCRSLARHGFRRILVLNGHGGNIAALAASALELQEKAGVAVAVATYWEVSAAQFAAILERQDGVRHGGEAETSMMLAVRPDLVDEGAMGTADGPSEALGPVGGVHRWRPISHFSGHGIVGVPSVATAEKGERLLGAAAAAIAERLADPVIWG